MDNYHLNRDLENINYRLECIKNNTSDYVNDNFINSILLFINNILLLIILLILWIVLC